MRMTKLLVSFNRHFFAIAILASAAGIALFVIFENPFVRAFLAAGVGLAVYFVVASVIAAFCIYDASDLYKLTWWPARCLDRSPEYGVLVHAGFDPTSAKIRANFPQMQLRILDFFDAKTTTEPSIQQAHRLVPPSEPGERIRVDAWPVDSASQDVVFAMTAVHELRGVQERIAFFRETKRIIKRGGKVIVIEQLRSFCNFACFGVAAFHFFSRRTWLEAFAATDLAVSDEFRITPFLRAFVLQSC